MKVAVSIPDDVFEEADRLAEQLGSTRSAVYARALRDHLRRYRDDQITAAMNTAIAEIDQEENLPFVRKATSDLLRRSDW